MSHLQLPVVEAEARTLGLISIHLRADACSLCSSSKLVYCMHDCGFIPALLDDRDKDDLQDNRAILKLKLSETKHSLRHEGPMRQYLLCGGRYVCSAAMLPQKCANGVVEGRSIACSGM